MIFYLIADLEVVNGFGLLIHWPDDPQERLLAFRINDDCDIKATLLKQLSHLIADANCTTNPVNYDRV